MATLTRTNAAEILKRLAATLGELSKEFGVSVKIESPKFDGLTLKGQLTMASVDASGKARSREIEDFDRWASHFGLASGDFGRSFVFRRSTYTISGINPNAPKFCVNAKRHDGKEFRFPAPLVKNLLPFASRAA